MGASNSEKLECTRADGTDRRSPVAFVAIFLAAVMSLFGAVTVGIVTGSLLWAAIVYGITTIVVFLGVILLFLGREKADLLQPPDRRNTQRPQ